MPHVVCLGRIHADGLALLRDAPGVTHEVLDPVTPDALATALPRAHALTVRATPIDRALIAAAPALRIVARHGVGYDAVDVDALTERGIPLTVTPDANAGSVAEHAMMLLLVCARRAGEYDARLRAGIWGASQELPTGDLAGRTLLLVGFGRIGARVARLALAFGMRVLVHDPGVPPNTIKGAGCTPAAALREALGEADAVSLHLPASAATRGFVDAAFLGAMRAGAVLVNTARGSLVVEDALVAALRSGRLAAAGTDVFAVEPAPASHPLLALPNVIATPHVAALTEEGKRRMAMACADSVLAYFSGTLSVDVTVNPQVLAARG